MKKIRTTKAIITIATIILSSFSNLLADRLIVGIIEQNFNNWDIDTINPFDIRVAFEKKNNEWKSFPTDFQPPNNCLPYYPKTLDWTICFNGKEIGKIKSILPETIDYYKDIGIHYIKNMNDVPRLGKPSEDFSGWIDKPVYRPIVVCTSSSCQDLEKWKPYVPSKMDISKALSVATTELLKDTTVDIYKKYKLEKSYKSINDKLICITIDNKVETNADTSDFAESKTGNNQYAWFLLSNSKCRYLKSNMRLIDAGDYDNDGKVEVVFKIEEYDHDGYVLYYDGFQKNSEFYWIYH